MATVLSSSTYGKDNVKFLKVKKDPKNAKVQDVMECSVKILLRGEFDRSYTDADNLSIVPTDTVKNTILVEAKKFDIWPIEKFAIHLAKHFIFKYAHVSGLEVTIQQFKWSKYNVQGKLHDHSFVKDGEDFKQVELDYNRNGDFKLKSGLKNLTVLKSTGSMFYGYNVCDYTTLQPTTDRILSTDIDLTYEFDSLKFASLESLFAKPASYFDYIFNTSLEVTLNRFALENSPSVQATMYNMGSEILEKVQDLKFVSYALPNKHYFLIDFKWKGLENDNELFYPSPHPNGLIKCTVGRSKPKL